MQMISKFESVIERVNTYSSFLTLILFILGWIGLKLEHNIIIYSTIALFCIILIASFFYITREWINKKDMFSYMRALLKEEEWKKIKATIMQDSISLIGNSDRATKTRETLIQQTIFYILVNKKHLTYNKASQLLEELIHRDNITDFNM